MIGQTNVSVMKSISLLTPVHMQKKLEMIILLCVTAVNIVLGNAVWTYDLLVFS
jgi:hypothetical protein